jgi:hypothetical protein
MVDDEVAVRKCFSLSLMSQKCCHDSFQQLLISKQHHGFQSLLCLGRIDAVTHNVNHSCSPTGGMLTD